MLFRSRRSDRFPATVFKNQPGSAYFVSLNTKEIGWSWDPRSSLSLSSELSGGLRETPFSTRFTFTPRLYVSVSVRVLVERGLTGC